ncbi:MAG: phosphate acetyltransferase [Saccharospirillaceae bacterium]|nr:phosphate acetyltransferase [Pseudomonadales bacterium]NRB78345.1 phosphate acetyltransferase [Saccharospirillaceae bacterium]
MYSIFIAPTSSSTGLTSVCLGLVRALDQIGIAVAFCKPIAQLTDSNQVDQSTFILKQTTALEPCEPLSLEYAQHLMSQGKEGQLMEEIVSIYSQSAKNADVVIVEGLVPIANENYIDRLNSAIAKTLNSDVILVAAKKHRSYAGLNKRIEMTASLFGGLNSKKLLGCILNKIGAPEDGQLQAGDEIIEVDEKQITLENISHKIPIFEKKSFRCLGLIYWNPDLISPRTLEVANYLKAKVISKGNMDTQRVKQITLAARTVPNMLHTLLPGTLLVTPGDREDILLAASLAVANGVPLAGILFTGDLLPDQRIIDLCEIAIDKGLTILSTKSNTYLTAQILNKMPSEVPSDDLERMEAVMESVADSLDVNWVEAQGKLSVDTRLSPPAFRYALVQRAKAANKTVVLPEGEEPRTIQAACICAQKQIAKCILLGRESEIVRIAQAHGYEIGNNIEIINPEDIQKNYIAGLVERRKHKGVTSQMAQSYLEDNVVLGTMMLAQNEVDGLVSGAIHTTANTIRPALQLIKTKPDAALVSSIFFMLLPEQVLVYGDCAVNPDPTAQELADIAIQSGDSAKAFGIEPKIAMISYSTGKSGKGSEVEKVREATRLAKAARPDLLIDGPLQYDAASVANVAKSKAPDSEVAGQATVFIFPDLNTGNTTYKAVQRSANLISIGPMLQGLNKPVNDLSRGALVDDIVYTIALTAIQAV